MNADDQTKSDTQSLLHPTWWEVEQGRFQHTHIIMLQNGLSIAYYSSCNLSSFTQQNKMLLCCYFPTTCSSQKEKRKTLKVRLKVLKGILSYTMFTLHAHDVFLLIQIYCILL